MTETKTQYPARIGFTLKEPRRARVLAAAKLLGLAVEHLSDDSFVVIVPDPMFAYELGQMSADQ